MSLFSTSWTTFHCENPDFIVRSVPDNMKFAVNRMSMEISEVFRDMFSFGEPASQESQVVDVHERSEVLIVLLHLLHYPPQPPVVLARADKVSEGAQMSSRRPHDVYDPSTVIPLPILLSLLLGLVDKYALSDSIAEALHAHVLVHAPIHSLQIYGYAVQHNLEEIASSASQYLMPIASYRSEEIQQIPNVLAYHKIVRLQNLRVEALRELVLREDIFPYGYGACLSHHKETNTLWDAKRFELASQIETVTDVAAEMSTLTNTLPKDCKMCHSACTAAVGMLAYKSRKTLRRIDQLPPEN